MANARYRRLTRPVDHHRRDPDEERLQCLRHWRRKLHFLEGAKHQLQPAVAGSHVDRERGVTHAQTGMTALLDITLGPAEAPNQEVSQPNLGAFHVFWWIHRPEDVIARNVPVERSDEPREAILANSLKDLDVVHLA